MEFRNVMGLLEDLAKAEMNKGDRIGFSCFKAEAVKNGVLVTGNYPTRVISRGPKKGRPDWRSSKHDDVRVFVTGQVIDAARADQLKEMET
jgi:hypothetical protein